MTLHEFEYHIIQERFPDETVKEVWEKICDEMKKLSPYDVRELIKKGGLREFIDLEEDYRFGTEGMTDIVERLRDKWQHSEDDCYAAADEIERLRKKCDTQATMLRSIDPERFPNTLFIHMHGGERDQNGMPERLYVVPAHGVDFSYVYTRTDKTVGPEW